jgi:hypothetical protein
VLQRWARRRGAGRRRPEEQERDGGCREAKADGHTLWPFVDNLSSFLLCASSYPCVSPPVAAARLAAERSGSGEATGAEEAAAGPPMEASVARSGVVGVVRAEAGVDGTAACVLEAVMGVGGVWVRVLPPFGGGEADALAEGVGTKCA